jgi:bacillopeptidase F (M6 metalloprotease family)
MAVTLMVTVGVAFAEKEPAGEFFQRAVEPCGFTTVTYDWDFAVSDHGFTPMICEDGGQPVWAYGEEVTIPGSPGYVWATGLNGSYVNNSGDGLMSPTFMVDGTTAFVEVDHYYDIETNFDGCNLKVNGTVVPPIAGYDGTISTSTSYYAYCVDLQEGLTGHDEIWRTDCWDLSAFEGEMVQLQFDFGTDSSVTYPGWYLAAVRVGGQVVPNEQTTWGSIKGMYK